MQEQFSYILVFLFWYSDGLSEVYFLNTVQKYL